MPAKIKKAPPTKAPMQKLPTTPSAKKTKRTSGGLKAW